MSRVTVVPVMCQDCRTIMGAESISESKIWIYEDKKDCPSCGSSQLRFVKDFLV